MNLLIVFPLTGIPSNGVENRKKEISNILGSEVNFEIKIINNGPLSIESKTEEAIAAYNLLQLLDNVETIENHYDGILIWCAGDPAVEALRERYDIPIVGPGQSMITFANLVSSRYGIVTPGRGDSEMIENLFFISGLNNRLVASQSLDMPILGLKNDLNYLITKISELGEKMIETSKIQSLMLGCLGFFGIGKEVEKKIGIPVIDPGIAGLNILKMMVEADLRFSKAKYPPIRKDVNINE